MALKNEFKNFINDLSTFISNEELVEKYQNLLSHLSYAEYQKFGKILNDNDIKLNRTPVFIQINSKEITEIDKQNFLHDLLFINNHAYKTKELVSYIIETIPHDWLVNKKNVEGNHTYLTYLIKQNYYSQLKKLQKIGININVVEGIHLTSYILKESNNIVEKITNLLNEGVNITPNENLWNEVFIKMLNEKYKEHEQQINIQQLNDLENLGFFPKKYIDNKLNTPLHYLLKDSFKTREMKFDVKPLLQKLWLYNNEQNEDSNTPLHSFFEAQYYNYIDLLEDFETDYTKENFNEQKPFDLLLKDERIKVFLEIDEYNCITPLKEDIKKYITNPENIEKVLDKKKYEEVKKSYEGLENLLKNGTKEEFNQYYISLDIKPDLIPAMVIYKDLIIDLVFILKANNITLSVYEYKLLFNVYYFYNYIAKKSFIPKEYMDKFILLLSNNQTYISSQNIASTVAIKNIFLPFESNMINAMTKDHLMLNNNTVFYKEYKKWYESLEQPQKNYYLMTVAKYFNVLHKEKVEEIVDSKEVASIVEAPLYTEEAYNNLNIHNQNNTNGEQAKNYFKKLKGVKSLNKKLALASKFLPKIQELYEQFPHFKEVIEHIENNMLLQNQGDKVFYIPPMLLAGGPGVGKTFFTHTVANIVETYFYILSMESVSAGFVITGMSDNWGNAQPGIVFKTIASPERTDLNPIILLDELDKAGGAGEFPVANSLLPLLEKYSAKKYKDECIPLEIDASNIIWIATANELDKISAPIKSRMDVFHIPNPTIHERKALIKGIYNATLKNNSWGSYFNPELSDESMTLLANMMTTGAARDLRRTIVTACAKAIKDNQKDILPKHIDTDKQPEKMPWDLTSDHQDNIQGK